MPKMLANPDEAFEGPTITLSQALENYHSIKGTGTDDLFFRSSERFVRYVIDGLGNRTLNQYTSPMPQRSVISYSRRIYLRAA